MTVIIGVTKKERGIAVHKFLKIFLSVFIQFALITNSVYGFPLFPEDKEMALAAKGAVLLNQDTGEILYTKNADKKMYPASTTKILTALIAIENGNLEEIITVGEEIAYVNPEASKAGLFPGQRISLKNLLKALMLPSGSDAAYSIAVNIGRKYSGDKGISTKEAKKVFVNLMNKKAKELGLKNSNFVNPDGMHQENHYSTPNDLAKISREAMTKPYFREVVQTASYLWDPGERVSKGGGKAPQKVALYWENTNLLLQKSSPYYSQNVTGIKTGFTTKAGYCLASSATSKDFHILAVVLNSTETGVWTDTQTLHNYGLARLEEKNHAGDVQVSGPDKDLDQAGSKAKSSSSLTARAEPLNTIAAISWPAMIALGAVLFTARLLRGSKRKNKRNRRL